MLQGQVLQSQGSAHLPTSLHGGWENGTLQPYHGGISPATPLEAAGGCSGCSLALDELLEVLGESSFAFGAGPGVCVYNPCGGCINPLDWEPAGDGAGEWECPAPGGVVGWGLSPQPLSRMWRAGSQAWRAVGGMAGVRSSLCSGRAQFRAWGLAVPWARVGNSQLKEEEQWDTLGAGGCRGAGEAGPGSGPGGLCKSCPTGDEGTGLRIRDTLPWDCPRCAWGQQLWSPWRCCGCKVSRSLCWALSWVQRGHTCAGVQALFRPSGSPMLVGAHTAALSVNPQSE